MPNTYLALTTGPLLPTMQQARSTRALWSASYLFSYFMKNVIAKFKEEPNKREFLVPFVDDHTLFTQPLKTGLFHDRFIFLQKEEGDFQKLQTVVNGVVKEIAKAMANDLSVNESLVELYLQNYLRHCALKIEIPDNENPIPVIDKLLDTLELEPVFNLKEDRNYFQEFIELKARKKQRNFLLRHAYADKINDDDFNKIRFSSIAEITTAEFSRDLFETPGDYWEIFGWEQEKPLEALERKLEKKLMRHHKYLTVLQADGDYMGKIIGQLFKNISVQVAERFKKFSEYLFDFDKEAEKLINAYGGMPVYVGGDDILCLAPLKCNGRHIFDLVDDLDKAFKEKVLNKMGEVLELISKDTQPSMTYGISISYYKHPLSEALAEAFQQMRIIAKTKRNAVSFRLLKHSGSHFSALVEKSGNLYKTHFKSMLKFSFDKTGKDEKTNAFLSSLQYKLNANNGVLEAIVHDSAAVTEFFRHNFNEGVHSQSRAFIDGVSDALTQAWVEISAEQIGDSEKRRKTIEVIHAMLRYVQFINQKPGDE